MRDLYNFRSRSYWLRRLENHDRKELVPLTEYTIEHILPQNENLSRAWRNALGEDWRQLRDTLLHTLGNLTLTGYNAEYNDRPFAEKRDMPGGFRESPLRLNEMLRELDSWDADAISARADRLASKALSVWEAPALSAELLKPYRTAAVKQARVYTLKDYANLDEGSPMWMLFEAFRKEVLALDPSVSEEFLKTYVAYRFENWLRGSGSSEKAAAFGTEHALPRVARSPRISIQRRPNYLVGPIGMCK